MITNERQYRITKAQESRFRKAVDAFDIDEATERIGSSVLARAELEALRSELEVLSEQIQEYEVLKSGTVTEITAENLNELPTILIRARISRGLTQRQLAKRLGLKEQQIQRYESDKYASASLRRLTEVASALDLNISKVVEIQQTSLTTPSAEPTDIEWERFPLKQMYLREWFDDFSGSLAEAMAIKEDLLEKFIKGAMPRRQPALLRHRARIGARMNLFALWAWQCRILYLAEQTTLDGTYARSLVTDEWLRKLAQASRFDDGPRRAKKILSQVGIPLIFEPHLEQTYLDGAAFLLPDGSPVIGMTLRFDRLDNFWFVLFHELIHVKKHLRKGKLEDIFDDLDADDPEPDDLEEEANLMAGNALISDSKWEIALARYLRTEESVVSLAEELKIHPSIIAGRIRKEAGNYVILSELVGKDEVRRQFPEVQFAQ